MPYRLATLSSKQANLNNSTNYNSLPFRATTPCRRVTAHDVTATIVAWRRFICLLFGLILRSVTVYSHTAWLILYQLRKKLWKFYAVKSIVSHFAPLILWRHNSLTLAVVVRWVWFSVVVIVSMEVLVTIFVTYPHISRFLSTLWVNEKYCRCICVCIGLSNDSFHLVRRRCRQHDQISCDLLLSILTN